MNGAAAALVACVAWSIGWQLFTNNSKQIHSAQRKKDGDTFTVRNKVADNNEPDESKPQRERGTQRQGSSDIKVRSMNNAPEQQATTPNEHRTSQSIYINRNIATDAHSQHSRQATAATRAQLVHSWFNKHRRANARTSRVRITNKSQASKIKVIGSHT